MMPNINNIPQEIIDEHIAWHERPGNPSEGGRSINPFPPFGRRPALGSGEEFLNWHQGFVQRFHDWVNGLPNNEQPSANDIAPWRAIPQMLKMSMLRWNVNLANEEQLLQDMSNFDSLDDLGRFLEWSLHGFLHNAASGMWNEPILLSFESPRSTYFWRLHGLIDHWRQQWVDNQQPSSSLFTMLQIGAGETEASIGAPGEVDRYQFTVTSENRYVVETTGPSDVVLYIAGPDNPQRLHSFNDDGGQGRNALVDTRFTPGTYFVYVVHYYSDQTGNYGISVTT